MEIIKPVAARQRCKAFDLLSTPREDHATEGSVILSDDLSLLSEGMETKKPVAPASAGARLLTS